MIRARVVALALLIGLAAFATAGSASAHNSLVSTNPADGASVDTGPSTVTLTFDQPVQDGFNTITVTGPDDTRWTTGGVTTSGNTASTPVLPLGPAGEYVVGYRVVSADGHPVSGELRFRLTTAGTGTPAPAQAAPESDGGFPVWPIIVGAVVLLGAGIAVAMRTARPRG